MSRPPARQYEVRRLDQIEALASPARSKILLVLSTRGPGSAREIAAWIGHEPDSIHYHLRTLIKAELVHIMEKRSIGPRSESVYEAVARVFHVDRRNRSPRYQASIKKTVRSGLRLAEREFDAALDDDRYAAGSRRLELHFQQQDVRLNAANFKEFMRLFDAARKFAAERHDPERGRWLTITTMITPGTSKTGS